MKIEGFVRDATPFITATLVIGNINLSHPVDFLVDSGASKTAILDKDAQEMQVNYERLEREEHQPIIGIGGACETFIAQNAAILFRCTDGSLVVENLDRVFFLRHPSEIPAERRNAMLLNSTLGRDMLFRYTMTLKRNTVWLKK